MKTEKKFSLEIQESEFFREGSSANGHNVVKFRAAWEMRVVVKWNDKMKVSPEGLETNALGYEQHSSSAAGQPQVWIH